MGRRGGGRGADRKSEPKSESGEPELPPGPARLEELVRDAAFLTEATPARLSAVPSGVDEPGSAVLRACRRALPRLRAAAKWERVGILRATAAVEEPRALDELDESAGFAPLGWTVP